MMDSQKTGNGLQVIGQGTGIGISALHMVGYSGKNCNSAEVTSDECCPACKEKGQIQALRTYRISFQESIFLCENPQCIYPLGYKPLNSIIIPAESENHQTRCTQRKRKIFEISPSASPIESCSKQARTNNNLIDAEHTLNTDLVLKCNGYNLCVAQPCLPDLSQDDQQKHNRATESLEHNVDLATAITVGGAQESPDSNSKTELLPNSELCSIKSEILHAENKPSLLMGHLCLQWRNIYALCWLDCILSALVHLKTLRIAVTEACTEESVIQRLFTKYNQATALLNACQTNKLKDVLPKAESHLNEIRNTIFAQLQPLLKCELGKKESPVFAFPLLLRKDPQVETLFLHSFSWMFECLHCGYSHQDRCRKTLTTFTNIIPDWHPLNAIHIAPCNNCNDKSQRRKMILEKVPSILMIHFVEGLPHNKLKNYSFQFEGDFYQITAVIQYQQDPKHFKTWVLNPDETWLECDDIKGPYCERRERFEVPVSEIHIVIWERKASQVPNKICSKVQSVKSENLPLNDVQSSSSLVLHCDSDNAVDKITTVCYEKEIVGIPANEQQKVARENENSLLSGLENLADDDIITLTLVEIQVDSEGKPLDNGQIVGNNLIAETGLLKEQGSACSDQTPCTEDVCSPTTSSNMCTPSENACTSLHLGPLNLAHTTSAVPTNHCNDSSTPSHAQEAEAKASPVNTENILLNPERLQNKKLPLMENVMQKSSNTRNTSKTRADSQAATLSATNNSSQSLHKDQRRGFIGSWVKGLLSKHNTFMPSSASTHHKKSYKNPLLRATDLHLPTKGAANFGGFQAKGTSKTTTTEGAPKSAVCEGGNLPPLLTNITGPSVHASLPAVNPVVDGPTLNKSGSSLGTWSTVIQPNTPIFNSKPSHGENGNHKSDVKDKESNPQTHKLRLKLLKKLKAKKNKLASLDRLAKTQMCNGSSPNRDVEDILQFGSHDESESVQNLLKELQYQIDVADSESVYSTNSNMSLCSSQSNAEFLADLLSPTSIVASLELPKDEDECRYLEMVDSNAAAPVHSERTNLTCVTVASEDHNYYSPVKESKYEGHTDSLMNKSCLKRLSFESPTKEDILEDLFSSAVLNSIAGDIDLPHFDETLFETC
uniref:Ubiquitin specific peptidase like 1 n=3 Tax=Chrysemys picta bellii TaxID=8478 RepID=A0A8C3I5J4_CHRPI|nr:SUMO-specific isopeptidase USPL1 isoform X1 [Chrysemys picta bellii]XP_023960952.1 SUMO-specific isopeptidase USPL1 isoform X1 [Chrysemys picta bellii]XP_042698768.1 SUMO-specific isopeptidase USPL1 isoform X1 [Chrysemys picta bellii]XP_042698769.1 SUMO-specific isopeptidase USPL1 isoform X1 [Chrysemys picta bellii]XP_042698770.1 SUMO-specific isopeptidase USPL1 isoform X1 [Chrysemys picta bellii]